MKTQDMKPKEKAETITVHLDPEMKVAVRMLAAQKNQSMARLLTDLLKSALEQQTKQPAGAGH